MGALRWAFLYTCFVVDLVVPSTALGLGSRFWIFRSSIPVETRHWMAPDPLPGHEPAALLSFSEEVSRVPPWDKHHGSAAATVNAATLDAWAHDAACRYPLWLAQSGFLLQWHPNELAGGAERFTAGAVEYSPTGAACCKEALRPCGGGGVLLLAGGVPVLEFGPVGSTSDDRAYAGGRAADIPIMGGLLTFVTRAPSTNGGLPCGTLTFACRQTENGELEFRTALSR
jgi:hypothetical protein